MVQGTDMEALMAARKKLDTVIVIANDPIEAASYVIPVKYDRLIVAAVGRERVEVPSTDRVVGLFMTPNVRRAPELWSTKGVLSTMFDFDVALLTETRSPSDEVIAEVVAEDANDAESEAE